MIDILKSPWPWWIAGPLVGLIVPTLLLWGNKPFGVSSNLRHICAACFPANIPFFKYNWKKEIWNLFFAGGILLGAAIAWTWLSDHKVVINYHLIEELKNYGITVDKQIVPAEVFNWNSLLTAKGFILIVGGGFLVGFGSRYAEGCTSGHAIMGLSNLQWPSLIATCCFMIGGIIAANFILPLILKL